MTDREIERALAFILGSRSKARELLAETTLRHLAALKDVELARFMPLTTARRLAAMFALGRAVLAPPRKTMLLTPVEAYAHVYPYLAGREAERFVVVAIDVQHQVLATTVVAEGAPNVVEVRPADVFAMAVRHRAAAIVTAHNHPSEIAKPSDADREMAKRHVEVGALLGIHVLDHLVVCGESYWGLVQDTWEMRVPIIQATP